MFKPNRYKRIPNTCSITLKFPVPIFNSHVAGLRHSKFEYFSYATVIYQDMRLISISGHWSAVPCRICYPLCYTKKRKSRKPYNGTDRIDRLFLKKIIFESSFFEKNCLLIVILDFQNIVEQLNFKNFRIFRELNFLSACMQIFLVYPCFALYLSFRRRVLLHAWTLMKMNMIFRFHSKFFLWIR